MAARDERRDGTAGAEVRGIGAFLAASRLRRGTRNAKTSAAGISPAARRALAQRPAASQTRFFACAAQPGRPPPGALGARWPRRGPGAGCARHGRWRRLFFRRTRRVAWRRPGPAGRGWQAGARTLAPASCRRLHQECGSGTFRPGRNETARQAGRTAQGGRRQAGAGAGEGFATFKAPFDKLGRDFSSAFGRTATLDPRIIERDQCPVADFLEALRPDAATSPGLELSKDRLKVGDSLQGKLTGAGKRDVNLLLIGKDGVVYNFASLLKRTDTGDATFSMKLFPLNDQEAGEPEPHLIMALASDGGIRAADIRDPELASDLFPKIRREIEAQPGMPGIAVGYFLFDR